MDSIIQILLGFVLFTLIENIIAAMFYEKCCGCKRLKWWQVLVMAVGYYVIATSLSPIVYQCVLVIYRVFSLFNNKAWKFKYFKYVVVWFLITLITEMPYAFLLEIFGIVNGLKCTSIFIRFLIIIFPKVVQVLFIIFGGKKMKNWLGTIKK